MTTKKTAKKTTASAPSVKAKAVAPSEKPAVKAAKKAAAKKTPKKVAAKKAIAKKAVTTAPVAQTATKPTPDAIARAAYLNYRKRIEQGLPGDSNDDWLAAERHFKRTSES